MDGPRIGGASRRESAAHCAASGERQAIRDALVMSGHDESCGVMPRRWRQNTA